MLQLHKIAWTSEYSVNTSTHEYVLCMFVSHCIIRTRLRVLQPVVNTVQTDCLRLGIEKKPTVYRVWDRPVGTVLYSVQCAEYTRSTLEYPYSALTTESE